MSIPRVTFFNFIFGAGDDFGRGIRTDQVRWSVPDPQLTDLLANLGAAGNTAFALTAAPDDANGANGDVAVALLSATELAGYKKESGAWTQVWTFSGGGGGGGLSTSQVQALESTPTNLSALQATGHRRADTRRPSSATPS